MKKTQIYDVVSIIIDYMLEELVAGRIVSIDNFGTFAVGQHEARVNRDLNGKFRITNDTNLIKFIPNKKLLDLIQIRKSLLLEVGTTSTDQE